MSRGITNDNIYILAYRFMDDGRPNLDKQLVWREQDVTTNLASIVSLLQTNDEILLIQVADYNRIMTSKPTDWQSLHEEIRSYSINIWKGANA